ncbi:MAG: hypothetical protein R2844_13770 [Caldilineales bacterium]
MLQQLAQQREDQRLVDPVEIVKGKDEGLADRIQIVQQVAGDYRRRRHGRRLQQVSGFQVCIGEDALNPAHKVACEEAQVFVGFVQGDPDAGIGAGFQPHAGQRGLAIAGRR